MMQKFMADGGMPPLNESGAPCGDSAPAHTIGAENAPAQPRGCNAQEMASDGRALTRDDPEFDATYYADPAWWRGHDHGVVAIVRAVARIARVVNALRAMQRVYENAEAAVDERVALAESVAAEALAENRALAVPLEWTTEKPTRPGYYWMRDSEAQPPRVTMCRVKEMSYGLAVNTIAGNQTEWAGPITPPASESEVSNVRV